MKIPIDEIKIGERFRKDLGNLDSLKASIEKLGLLHPIVVSPGRDLLCGRRRIEAYKQLGRDKIEVTVLDIDDFLSAESDENVIRENFSPSDAVETAKAIEAREKDLAKERQREHGGTAPGKKKNTSVKLTQVNQKASQKKSKSKAAKAVGMSRNTLAKAQEVVEAAREEPDKYGDLVDKMDASGKVDSAKKELDRRKREEARVEAAKSAPEDPRVIDGDFLEEGSVIADDSVDMVFTDPPYHDIDAYAKLAEFAARVLRPGALCITYLGHEHLPAVIDAMSKHLQYVWVCGNFQTGGKPRIWKYNISVGWKPVLMYCKPPMEHWWTAFVDTVSGKQEKEGHDWQQSEAEAEHYIRGLCPSGGLVVDPFCGSGTTLCAAKKLGMKYTGFDIDPKNAAYSRRRLADIDATGDSA